MCLSSPGWLRQLGVVGLLAGASAQAIASDGISACRPIVDPSARLACFDALAARADASDSAAIISTVVTPAEPTTPLERRRSREVTLLDNPYGLIAHRANYLLPVTYNSDPNRAPFEETFPGVDMDRVEAKFQISFKANLWNFSDRLDLWAAYTQESWWQVYNDHGSAPFRETNYQPELYLAYQPVTGALGFDIPALMLGINHQSNGRGGDLSRGWDRIIASAALERGNFVLHPRVWWRIPEDDEDDDNPRTDDFYGYGDLRLGYAWREMSFGALLRSNLRTDDHRSAFQLDWSFPLNRRFKGYVQWFHGYGESLIDYDEKTSRIGIGLMMTDWL